MKSSLTALAETAKLQTAMLKKITKAQVITVAEWQLLIQLAAGGQYARKIGDSHAA